MADLQSLVEMQRVEVSPDGARLAYQTLTARTGATDPASSTTWISELWVCDLKDLEGSRCTKIAASGEPNEPAPYDGIGMSWSPDSASLAFYTGFEKKGGIAIWSAASAAVKTLEGTTDVGAAAYARTPIQWTPDSRRVLIAQVAAALPAQAGSVKPSEPAKPTGRAESEPNIKVLTSGPTESSRVADDLIHRRPADPATNVDLELIEVRSGAVTLLAKAVPVDSYRLAPDGRSIAYTIGTGSVSEDEYRQMYDLYVADGGPPRRLLADVLGMSPRLFWSHDGRKLAFIGGRLSEEVGAQVPPRTEAERTAGTLYVVDLAHPGAAQPFARRGLSTYSIVPLMWSPDDRRVYGYRADRSDLLAVSLSIGAVRPLLRPHDPWWLTYVAMSQRSGDLYALGYDEEGRDSIYEIEAESERSRLIYRQAADLSWLSVSADGGRLAYLQEGVAQPSDVWVASRHLASARQLTHANPAIEQRSLSAEQRTVRWAGRAGRGVVLLPVGYEAGKRYPTLVNVYAGERAGTGGRNSFGMQWGYFNAQLFAGRGYAVFVPDTTLRVGHPMQDIASEVLGGVDELIKMGIADPERLGVYGQSYGGYSALSLIVQTSRFKAAVSCSGFSNAIAMSFPADGSDGSGFFLASGQGRLGATVWQDRERFIENSPFFFLDRVQTPVLLEYGATDALAEQSRETFAALRSLGKTAVLVGYAGEGHGLEKPDNQRDFFQRMLGWFNQYLR